MTPGQASFQFLALPVSTHDAVTSAIDWTRRCRASAFARALAGKGIREQAKELMNKAGLSDRLHHYPAQLSGGEQQRVSLARAFAGQPRILFADEPTGNLDAETSEKIVQLLLDLNREAGTTLIIVTHNMELAGSTQRIIRLKGGHMIADETR